MKINYFEVNTDSSPVLDFIQAQPPKAQAKIQKIVDFFENTGVSLLNSGYMEKLKEYGIYELKISWSGIAYRIFVVIKNAVAYLVHAFIKKTQKTPLHEINIALNRKRLLDSQLAFQY